MAKMFPPTIPEYILKDPKRSAEILVFEELEQQLDDSFRVFYSSPWLGTTSDGREIDGEADFVIANSKMGILVVEVKGGRVAVDENNEWTSTDRHNICQKIKNPVEQARNSKYELLKKLKEHPSFPGNFINIVHAVILPHVAEPKFSLRPDMPLKIFAFEHDIERMDEWVEERLLIEGKQASPELLGDKSLDALDDMLAKPISMRVRLNSNIREDMKDILLKTEEQVFILRELEENRRMAISGAAGTGKTVLAMEKAHLLSDGGLRVLLLCFNRPLGSYLSRQLADLPGVTATHFHSFARQIAIAAGCDPQTLDYEKAAKDLVENFVKADIDEYDAILIDEGQDFKDDWLTSLEVCVKGSNEGVLYIFYDDNQNVMSQGAEYIRNMPVAKHSLRRNFRNTQLIFEMSKPYYRGPFLRCIGPRGSDIRRLLLPRQGNLRLSLLERLGSLIKTEGVRLADIAILLPNQTLIKDITKGKSDVFGSYPYTNAESQGEDKVIIDTIRRFKGLERPVVMMVLDASTLEEKELIYTGLTRAQAHLELLGSKAVLDSL